MEGERIKEIMIQRKNMKYRLVFQGIIVGLVTGVVIVLNRILINKFSLLFNNFYSWGNKDLLKAILVIGILATIGIIVGIMVRHDFR